MTPRSIEIAASPERTLGDGTLHFLREFRTRRNMV
jgi:hypothetical protein